MTRRDQGGAEGSALLELVAVMDRLRRECPWDREQTHRSLVRYLLEETHEVIEAIEGLDEHGPEHLREELGDLLLQVYFHARLGEERTEGAFDIDDVARGIVEKLVRRHPHVFGDADGRVDASDVATVEANWETLKAAEKQRDSVLDGIAPTLPGLSLADKVLSRAERAGITPTLEILPTLSALEEPDEVRSGWGVSGRGDAEAAVGEQLLAVVMRARELDVDPEQALRSAVRRFSAEVRAQESAADR